MQESRQPRILIVEGGSLTAIGLCEKVQLLDCITISDNSHSNNVIPLIEKEKPDLVLIDIRTQGESNGIEIAKSIKNKFQIPVIFITSSNEYSVLEQEKENLLPVLYQPSGRPSLAQGWIPYLAAGVVWMATLGVMTAGLPQQGVWMSYAGTGAVAGTIVYILMKGGISR